MSPPSPSFFILHHAFLSSIIFFIFTFSPFTLALIHGSSSSAFHLPMVYKFSDAFSAEMQRRGIHHQPLPNVGSLEHYQLLSLHDRHRRLLLNDTPQYSLSPSNETVLLQALGSLHYTFVTIGTPNQSYFVALDTGSDLLWIPCNCIECAEANWAAYGISLKDFSIYSPSNSSTSKVISCDDPICASQQLNPSCDSTRRCNYNISYLSANTSSSGIIVQDLLFLNSEDENHGSIKTPIYFGCGERQTGIFTVGAVDGLFGLGPDVYSVPSTLSRNKTVPNVFSMCFSFDGSGRLVFGKMPSSTSQQTPLIPHSPSVYYALEVTNLLLGGSNITISNSSKWIFDTGTSYTVLPTDMVTTFGELINGNIGLQSFSIQIDEDFILRYCWNLTNVNDLLNLTIVFGGGASWDIQSPYLKVIVTDSTTNNSLVFICLGVVDSDDPGIIIIGMNFMAGYEYFFDQGSMTFSWALSDCYTFNESESQISPAPSPAPSSSIPSGSFQDMSPSTRTIATPSQVSRGTSKSSVKRAPLIWALTIFFITTISLTLP